MKVKRFRAVLYFAVLLCLLVVISISFSLGQEVFEGLYGAQKEEQPSTYEMNSSILSTEGGKLQTGIYKTGDGKEYNVEKTEKGYVIDGIAVSGKDVKYDGENIELSGKGSINGVPVSGDKVYYSKDGGYRIEGSGKLNDVSVSNAKNIMLNQDGSMIGTSEKSCSVNGIQFKDEGTKFVYDPNKKEISPTCADKACNIAIDPKTLGKDSITISSANAYNLYSSDGKSSINVDGKINVDNDGNLILKGGYNEKDRFETTINGYKVSSRTDLKIDIRQNENVDQAKIDSLSKEKDPSKEYIPEETMVIFKDFVVVRSSVGTDVSMGNDSNKFMISYDGIVQFQKKSDDKQKSVVNFIHGEIRYGDYLQYKNDEGNGMISYAANILENKINIPEDLSITAKGIDGEREIIISRGRDGGFQEVDKSQLIDSKGKSSQKDDRLKKQAKRPTESQKRDLNEENIDPKVSQAISKSVPEGQQELVKAFALAECTGKPSCSKSPDGNVGTYQIGPESAIETINKNPEMFRKEIGAYNIEDQGKIASLLEKDLGFASKVCASIVKDCQENTCEGMGDMCVALCYKNGPNAAKRMITSNRISKSSKSYLGKIDYVLNQGSKNNQDTTSSGNSGQTFASLSG